MSRGVKAVPPTRKKFARPSATPDAVKLSIYLSPEAIEEVRAVAEKHERTVSWVVARALKQMLERTREGAAS